MMKILLVISGLIAGIILSRILSILFGRSSEQTGRNIRLSAEAEAEKILKEAELKSKEQLIKIREDFDRSTKDKRDDLQDHEKRLNEREINIERKMNLVQNMETEIKTREDQIKGTENKLQSKIDELDEILKKEIVQLEEISMTTRDQARVKLMQKLENELVNERGTLIRKTIDEIKQQCKKESQNLIVQAMQRFSGQCAHERTTATVPLLSDDMKGRIIGREGRNIRVFEAETGVNLLIDDTPSAVVITCFDPKRLAIARIALERLVEDGRIHPTRVEDVVENAKGEIETEIITAGENAAHELQIAGLAPQVIEVLGKLKFRYSYSQNVLKHSIEVGKFMAVIAAELGLNIERAKRMGLLHDIGKALDSDIEGPHAIIGRDFLKRAGEDPEVLNGVGCHHGEIPAETPLAALVSVCDAMSASRPGARSETDEFYIKRLEQLEEIGNKFKGVESCYAVQAGRELRIIVEPEKIPENEALCLSRDIVKKIESEMQYPGQIKVCVIRETRSIEYAK